MGEIRLKKDYAPNERIRTVTVSPTNTWGISFAALQEETRRDIIIDLNFALIEMKLHREELTLHLGIETMDQLLIKLIINKRENKL